MSLQQMVYGDLLPIIQATLQNSDGSVVNLTGASVVFLLTQAGQTLIQKPAAIVNAAQGTVSYTWTAGDTNQVGLCQASFLVTFTGGSTQTFPLSGDFYILFLGTPNANQTAQQGYISMTDVIATLNLSFDPVAVAFTVYGLKLTPQSIQAAVDFANKYVQTLLSSSTKTGIAVAWMAALDIACIRILVISMGGSLVGAYDYFLGDLRVARSGPYKEAITATLQGFKDDLARHMTNLSTVAVAFTPDLAGEVDTSEGPLLSP